MIRKPLYLKLLAALRFVRRPLDDNETSKRSPVFGCADLKTNTNLYRKNLLAKYMVLIHGC